MSGMEAFCLISVVVAAVFGFVVGLLTAGDDER